MEKVRTNATKKIKKVLQTTTWEFFSNNNNYEGGKFGKVNHLNHTLEDIQDKRAILYKEGEKYTLQFAGHCKWVSQ